MKTRPVHTLAILRCATVPETYAQYLELTSFMFSEDHERVYSNGLTPLDDLPEMRALYTFAEYEAFVMYVLECLKPQPQRNRGGYRTWAHIKCGSPAEFRIAHFICNLCHYHRENWKVLGPGMMEVGCFEFNPEWRNLKKKGLLDTKGYQAWDRWEPYEPCGCHWLPDWAMRHRNNYEDTVSYILAPAPKVVGLRVRVPRKLCGGCYPHITTCHRCHSRSIH